jgi:hypothetical protein
MDRKLVGFEHLRSTKFGGADCNTIQYLVVAKVWENLAIRKQTAQNLTSEDLSSGI